MTTHSAEIPVNIEENLHLRPMQLLVEAAVRFQCDLILSRGQKRADAKSILDVMMLAAEQGPLQLQANGADAPQAIEAMTALLHKELNRE